MLGTAVVLGLFLGTPAVAQSLHDIQRLEERVNEAKARGNWGAAQDLEVQLNMARLQYQRAHGLGEVNDRGYFPGYGPASGAGYGPGYGPGYPSNYPGYYPGGNRGEDCQPGYNAGYNNSGSYFPAANNDRRQQQRGYYDRRGRWHSY